VAVIKGVAKEIAWTWSGKTVEVGMERLGSGPTVLLLPALSSISTRKEMWPLQIRLASAYETNSVDWPGFGDRAKPEIDWRPEAYAAFLDHLVSQVVPQPFATCAAGHASAYVLAQAVAAPGSMGRLCLIAPTWRGPLPTMTGKPKEAFEWIVHGVDRPLLGPMLYKLNVNPLMVRMMGRGHVYADSNWLAGPRLADKLTVTRSKGARHASVRFVTGALDKVRNRAEFLSLAAQVADPILVLYGAGTPPKSKAEMEALAGLKNVRTVELPSGKLAVHEEFPDDTASAIRAFLLEGTSGRTP
jgi:pimeloyl-ACP methyl ester carboxylesterase